MKMETAKIEYEIFDCADVITTSGGGEPIPVAYEMIWLSMDSINNYNDFYPTGDTNLATDYYTDGYNYLAFNGLKNKSGSIFTATMGSDDKPDDQYLFEVKNSSDKEGYNRVLNWLQSRQ